MPHTFRRITLAVLLALPVALPFDVFAAGPPHSNALVVVDSELALDSETSVTLFGYVHLVSRFAPDGQSVHITANVSANFAAYDADAIELGPLKQRLQELKQRAIGLKEQIQAKQAEILLLQGQEPPDSAAVQRAAAEMKRLQEELRAVMGEMKSVMNQIEAAADREADSNYTVVGAATSRSEVSGLSSHPAPVFSLVDSAGRRTNFVVQLSLAFWPDGSLRSTNVDSVSKVVICGPNSDTCD